MSWKCPECKHVIEELQYWVTTQSSEYGTASLSDKFEIINYKIIDDHNSDDQGDTEWDGSPEYKCPECENEISPTDLIWETDKSEEDTKPLIPLEPEETLHKIICPKIQIIRKECPKDSSNSTLICKECKHIFVCCTGNYDSEGTFECPKCYETNTVKEYKELLLKGFFEPNYDRKKT